MHEDPTFATVHGTTAVVRTLTKSRVGGTLQESHTPPKKPRVLIVFFPWAARGPYKSLGDVLKILEPLSERIMVVGGNTNRIARSGSRQLFFDIGISMHYSKDIRPRPYSIFLWLKKCVQVQLRSALVLIKHRSEFDIVIFYVADPYHLVPLVASKLLGKCTIEIVTKSRPPASLAASVFRFQDAIVFRLLDKIVPESRGIVDGLDLGKHYEKLRSEGARFIDFSRYSVRKDIGDRGRIVGYIGRLSPEKGIKEFLQAIRLISKNHKEIAYVIGGTGPLLEWVETESKSIHEEEGAIVTVRGFVPEDQMADVLNEMRLFVLPTMHAEGLPTIVLEAMACGTPVLATPRGAVTDVIEHRKTGFLLDSLAPGRIAHSILEALEYDGLEDVSAAARSSVVEQYSFSKALVRWRTILDESDRTNL